MMAEAMGGRVSKSEFEMIIDREVLDIKDDFFELPYVKSLGMDGKKPLVIAQSHGDRIVELPEGAKNFARSKTAEIEIFGIGKNFLGFQGHPDLNENWAKHSVDHKHKHKHSKEDHDHSEFFPVTHKEITMICYNFLKGKHDCEDF